MNIIELAKKNNLIKELKDIDIVEDNSIYLNEEKSNYNFKYNAGDIVFVKKYNYSDGTNGSNHLFLIIEDNYIVSMDYFCLLISSQLDKLKYVIVLAITSPYPLTFRGVFSFVSESRDIQSIRRAFPNQAATFLLSLF